MNPSFGTKISIFHIVYQSGHWRIRRTKERIWLFIIPFLSVKPTVIFIIFIENPFQVHFNNSYNTDGQLIRISQSPRKLKRNRISKTKIYEFDSIWITIIWFWSERWPYIPRMIFWAIFCIILYSFFLSDPSVNLYE